MPRESRSSRHQSRSTRTGRAYTLVVSSKVEVTEEENVTLRAGVELQFNEATADQPTAEQLAVAQADLDSLRDTLERNADWFYGASCGTRQTFDSCAHQWKGMTERSAQDHMRHHTWSRAKALRENESFLASCRSNQSEWTKYYEETRKPTWVERREREALEASAPSNEMTAQETYDAEVESGVMTADELADLAFRLGLE